MNFINKDFHPKIIVVGSCSIDEIISLPSFPTAGSTIISQNFGFTYGGKGANQAVGTARLGAKSYFMGAVGQDPNGQQILRHLKKDDVNIAYVIESQDLPTGNALVLESPEGNSVLVEPGANKNLTPHILREFKKAFYDTDFILCQSEISNKTIIETFSIAENFNIPIGFYASPLQQPYLDFISKSRFFLLKEKDFKDLYFNTHKGFQGYESELENLLVRHPEKLVLLLGNSGKMFASKNGIIQHLKPSRVPLYSLGMGDAFASGLAVALSHGHIFYDACSFAQEVSFLASRDKGAQDSLPKLRDLLALPK